MQGMWRKVLAGSGAIMAAGTLVTILGGCSTEIGGFGPKPSAVTANRVDSPLTAPTGVLETSSIPAPTPARTAAAAIAPQTAQAVPLTPPPANPGAAAFAPSSAHEQLAGAWNFSWNDGRSTCPVTLATTRGLSGMAAQADVSCPSEIFMTKGWEMMGSDLVLQNHQGKITARLRPSGPNTYVGAMTETNQQVALAR